MILSILKIIGVIILVMLFLILLVVLLVLVFPITYQFDGSYYDKMDAKVRIRYAPVGFRVMVSYDQGGCLYVVRLFGGVVMTNTDVRLSWLGRKFFSHTVREKTETSDKQNVFDEDRKETQDNAFFDSEKREYDKQDAMDNLETEKKKNPFLFKKIQEKRTCLKRRFHDTIQGMKNWKKKKETLDKLFRSKRFQTAKTDCIKYCKRFWGIIKPGCLEGNIRFGFEDPSTTGKVLGICSVFLCIYQNYLDISPDFDNACLEGDIKGNGKIYPGALLVLAIQVISNKNLIKVTKKVQTIIEA